MPDQEELEQTYLTRQTNPESLHQPIFYKKRFSNKHKHKRNSHFFINATDKNTNHNASKDEAFSKTSSYLSNTHKQGFLSDPYDNQGQYIRKERHSGMKKMNESKSVENKLSLMGQYEQNLFKKMTIHCIRAETETYQNNCQNLERQYNYILKKIQKQKRVKFLSQIKEKKLEQIKQQKRKLSQDIKKERKISIKKELNNNKSTKNAIMAQRASTQLSIQKKRKQNMHSAQLQRLNQQYFHSQLQNSMLQQLRKKRQIYQKQKQAEEERKHNLSKNKQIRRLQAKKQYRNKWLNQLERSNIARWQFRQKKEQIESNLKIALQNYLQNQRRLKE